MTRYATNTDVSSERSRAEIERTLQRYGADRFGYTTSRTEAVLGFTCTGWTVRFVLPMPDPAARKFTHTEAKGLKRSPAQAHEAWEQACRQKWRALNLVVKAKLEAVESGITTFEDEFLAHIVLPNGQTVGQQALPKVREAYATGGNVPLLTFGG
jgi:hypothetical protein